MDAAHCTVESNYLFGTQGKSVNYGIESYVASDNLVDNNILQHVVAPMMVQPASASVFAYNYAINDTYDDGFASNPLHWMIGMVDQHNAGVEYNLYEGNIGPGIGADVIHGNQLANTLFRNYLLGSDPGRTDATIAVTLSLLQSLSQHRRQRARHARLHDDVRGELAASGNPATVFNLGGGNTENAVTIPDDPLVETTLMRWGNYDVVTNPAHFDATDVPSGITPLRQRSPGQPDAARVVLSRPPSPASGRPPKRGPPSAPTSAAATSPASADTSTPSRPRTASQGDGRARRRQRKPADVQRRRLLPLRARAGRDRRPHKLVALTPSPRASAEPPG